MIGLVGEEKEAKMIVQIKWCNNWTLKNNLFLPP